MSCWGCETQTLEKGPPWRVTKPELLVKPCVTLHSERHEAVQGKGHYRRVENPLWELVTIPSIGFDGEYDTCRE